MRTVIIEDELPAIETLTLLLEKYCPDIEITGVARSFKEGYDLCRQSKPALIFCDIQLHAAEGTGLSLVQLLNDRDMKIIFITGSKDFAADAFRVNAVDYLLKPVNIQELMTAVDKARRLQTAPAVSTGNLHIPTRHGFLITPFSDIVRCEADGPYTHFYFSGRHSKQTISVSIGQIAPKLPEALFFRVHKTHIINRAHIVEYIRGDSAATARMTDNSEVPISRLARETFIKWLG